MILVGTKIMLSASEDSYFSIFCVQKQKERKKRKKMTQESTQEWFLFQYQKLFDENLFLINFDSFRNSLKISSWSKSEINLLSSAGNVASFTLEVNDGKCHSWHSELMVNFMKKLKSFHVSSLIERLIFCDWNLLCSEWANVICSSDWRLMLWVLLLIISHERFLLH